MDLHLADKVVWITGASGGIGRALARVFADEGARLALHGHSGSVALETWVAEQDFAMRALCVQADVRDARALEANAAAIRERFGRLDACVVNAGVWPREDRGLHELDPERLRDTIEVDLVGALLTARAFLRELARSGPRDDGHGAALTFIGSTAGRFGERGHCDYAAAKAGLVGAMRSLKNEVVALDPCARVNVVEPGWTVTHMAREALEEPGTVERVVRTMPLQQLGRAEDVARAVAWLSSPVAAAHVSGQVLTVAGGMEGRMLWEDGDVDRAAVLDRLERE